MLIYKIIPPQKFSVFMHGSINLRSAKLCYLNISKGNHAEADLKNANLENWKERCTCGFYVDK